VAQELAAQMIGVKSLALPTEPSGVDREVIGVAPGSVVPCSAMTIQAASVV
jgi:hypothetical protein